MGARRSGQRGVVGGIEVLPFGLLIFVGGALLIANAWAVVDAKLTVEASAREAGRAYGEAPDGDRAARAADAAARDVIANAGRNPERLILERRGRFERCQVVEHTATYRVPALTIPFVGGFGQGTTVVGRHREVVDPFRAGLGGSDSCGP